MGKTLIEKRSVIGLFTDESRAADAMDALKAEGMVPMSTRC